MHFTVFSLSRSLRRLAPPLVLGTVALVTATLTACNGDTGPGSVAVNYVLGNSKTCEEVGVADIQAVLYRGDYDNPDVRHSEMIGCNDDGVVVVDGVAPDLYEVRVIGYDDAGVATFDNLGQPDAERVVEVFEAAESTYDANLTARPAQLLVRWRLGADGFGNCSGVGIDRFEIVAYQVGGGSVLLESEIGCEEAGDSQGYHLVPDPDRELNAVLFGEVGIQAVAADGSPVGNPAPFIFDPVGAGYSIELQIECTEAGCTST